MTDTPSYRAANAAICFKPHYHAVAQVQVGAADAVVAQQQRRLPEDCQRCIAAQQALVAARRPPLSLLSRLHKTITKGCVSHYR